MPENDGFAINISMVKMIDSHYELNLLKKMIKDSINKLNQLIQEYQNIHSDVFIYDTFADIRNKVDLHREKLIEEINKIYHEIINELKVKESKCKENANKLIRVNFENQLTNDLSAWKQTIKIPNIDEAKLNELSSKINRLYTNIQNEMKNYKNNLLLNEKIEFNKIKNKSLFGELIVMTEKDINAHLYLDINIILEKDFYDNLGNKDLFDPSKTKDSTNLLKVDKSSTMIEATRQIAEFLNQQSIDDIRIWPMVTRYNKTTRPLNNIDLKESANKTVLEMSKQASQWIILVEQSCDLSFSPSFDYNLLLDRELSHRERQKMIQIHQQQCIRELKPFNAKDDVMIFFKFYEPRTSTLRYVFRMHLPISSTLGDFLLDIDLFIFIL